MTPRLVEALWRSPAAAALAPLALVYRGALAARARVVRPERVGAPVVSVGNLAVGGAGKTPLVLRLALDLRAAGRRVAIVARGYGGDVERRGGISIVTDGDPAHRPPAAEVGDEPAMLAGRLASAGGGVPIVVSPDRVAAARLAVRRFRPDVVLADDAFQHIALDRDIDLVCVDGRDDPGRLRLLPAGPLREPLSALDRAEVVVATKVEGEAAERAKDRLRRLAPHAAVFAARARVLGAFDAEGRAVDLAGREVVTVAGIARPEDFEAAVETLGGRIAARLRYPDHHPYAPEDVGVVVAAAAPDRLVATTEKDAVRLAAHAGLPRDRLAVVSVDLEPDGDLAGWIVGRLAATAPPSDDPEEPEEA